MLKLYLILTIQEVHNLNFLIKKLIFIKIKKNKKLYKVVEDLYAILNTNGNDYYTNINNNYY